MSALSRIKLAFGKAAYEAYCAEAQAKPHTSPLPVWVELGEEAQRTWCKVAEAAIDAYFYEFGEYHD